MSSLPSKEQAQALWSVDGFMWRRVRLWGGMALAISAGCGRVGIRHSQGKGCCPRASPGWAGQQGGSALPPSPAALAALHVGSPCSPPWHRCGAQPGAVRGEHPRSSPMGPQGAGGQAGGVWGFLAIGMPCPFPPLEHTGCWELLTLGKECPRCWKQVLTGGPWGSAGCF